MSDADGTTIRDVERSVTLEDVLSWGPCSYYTRDRLIGLAAGRGRITAREILDLGIPAEDRLWAALREVLIPAAILHEFACRCAEAALHRERERGHEPDPRCWRAIEVKRAWLRGEASDVELAAARAAAWAVAWDAARAAARAAAWAAARDAAWAAARDAARAAARDAARAAARDAAWAAARDAARAAHVDILRSLLSPPIPEEVAR